MEVSFNEFISNLPSDKDNDIRPVIKQTTLAYLSGLPHPDRGTREQMLIEDVWEKKIVPKKSPPNRPTKDGRGRGQGSTDYYTNIISDWSKADASKRRDRKLAWGVFYYFFRYVQDATYFIEIAKRTWPESSPVFQRFVYAKSGGAAGDSFDRISARFRADERIVRREFTKIWHGEPLGAPSNIHLGPVTIDFSDGDNLARLSLQEPAAQDYLTDGLPDVFKALDWRSRLSGFHGRGEHVARLEQWAIDTERTLKVILVSGPGGAGKTRLAADSVSRLVHDQGWSGGFLGDAARPIAGGSPGVALIIDDPEERTNLVVEILKAASLALKNGETFGRLVRIILVSREGRDAWANILNEPATFIEEITLDARPHLEMEDALAIAGDIALQYPEHLGRAATDFSGVESWLAKDATHRLPLNVVAASVHAVLDPGRAFKLDGAVLLTTLAEWELRRVRFYSTRNLGNRDALEKLLGLSVLTRLGLTKQSVFELGEKGICPGKTGDGLLEAIRQTPYWQNSTDGNPSHLRKLEPDRPAAIFALKTLKLDDPSPGLPHWLTPAATQDADGFGERLNRLSFDIGQVDSAASRNIEQECIAMLDLQPTLISRFRGIASSYLPVFSAAFAIEICRRLLQTDSELDDDNRTAIGNNLANMLSDLGQHDAALEVSRQVVSISRKLAASGSPVFLAKLAASLNNRSCILADAHDRDGALEAIDEAVSIHRSLAFFGTDQVKIDLAIALSNQGSRLSEVERHEDALEAVNEAVSINRHLVQAGTDSALNRLAGALNNQANKLANIGNHEAALTAAQEAVLIHRKLVNARPDIFLQNLAITLTTEGQRLFALGQYKAALEVLEETISIRSRLANLRPDAFLLDLATTLSNTAQMLVDIGHPEVALSVVCDAVDMYRRRPSVRVDAFLEKLAGSLDYLASRLRQPAALKALDMAVSVYQQLASANSAPILPALANALNQQANRLSDIGKHEAALESIANALSIFRVLADASPDVYRADLGRVLMNQADTLASIERHEEALEAIDEAVSLLRHVAADKGETALPDLANALNNQADTLSLVGRHEAALQAIDEAISLSRDGGAIVALAIWNHTKASILLRAGSWPAALAASTDSISILRPYFLEDPRSHPAIATMVRLYFHLCRLASGTPDMELLQPILDRYDQS